MGEAQHRIEKIVLEPIDFVAGPKIENGILAFFTLEVLPGNQVDYFNARLTNPTNGYTEWCVENLPLLPSEEAYALSYIINLEKFSAPYTSLRCTYTDTTWQINEHFVSSSVMTLTPSPVEYFIPSGSDDPPLLIQHRPAKPQPPEKKPPKQEITILNRGRAMPNIDLDAKKDKTDFMACGPAAAANSLQWLRSQHKELQGDTTSLRSKVDSLKKYMHRSDKIGVRFDSMVVGKLTLIDQLRLPIRVKYKTRHESGNTSAPLKSTRPPGHTADNQGAKDVYPDFDWLKKEMDDGEDVEIHVGWYGPPNKNGERERVGGHWLVASGYYASKTIQGIFVKDDNDQKQAGGTRTVYHRWKKLPKSDEPYLDGLKDDKGNIAIVESVVSESFDPEVTFPTAMSTVPFPWDQIDLTALEMKSGYPFVMPVPFPWIPVTGGIIAAGAGTYLLVKENNNEEACTFSVGVETTNSNCGLANGSATIIPSPADEYNYEWSNGNTGPTLINVTAGTYTITITRTGTDCIRVTQAIIGNTKIPIEANVTGRDSDCDVPNGSATITLITTGDYTYEWSNGSNTKDQSGLAPGSYTVTIIAGVDCQQVYSVQIGENPFDIHVTLNTTQASCGQSNGIITAVVDPPGKYQYSWSNGESGQTLTNVEANEYTLTVSIAGTTCSVEALVTLEEEPFPYEVTFDVVPAMCGTPDGSVTANVAPQGEYDFQWSDGSSMQTLSGVTTGTYQLTITDIPTSCSGIFEVMVDELPPEFSITFSTTPAGCGQANGSAVSSVDPPGTYNYLWSNGNTTSSLTDVPAGTYIVTITLSGTSCSDSASVVVEQTGITFTVTTTSSNADCGISNGIAIAMVDPPGTYQYQWSNNQTTPVLQGVSAGVYMLTVTDNQSCISITEIPIGENPAAYIDLLGVTPGDCLNGGDLTFTLTTPAAGPLGVIITGPEGSSSLVLMPGTYLLSSFFNVFPGSYSLVVTDQTISSHCRDSITTIVEDLSPDPVATDDFFTTSGGQAITENVLTNDSGLSLTLTDVYNAFGGTVTFGEDGTFTFFPDIGFTGEASFEYTVTDTCGNSTTAIVFIFVEQTECAYEVVFEIFPASCGLADGIVGIEIFPKGNYEYNWNTGEQGQVLHDLIPGIYTVTITDENLGCTQEFSAELTELLPDHIEGVDVFQPDCSSPGEIRFTATSNSMNPLVMIVEHPNGTDLFFVEPELIVLSDYVTITPGEYFITIFDVEAGEDCAEVVAVTLETPQGIEIFAEAIIPPTEPSAMDGIAIIVAIIPGVLPYDILLNGSSWGVAIDHTFPVGGLGPGEYTIQIIDATGCASNILPVFIPFPGLGLDFGLNIISSSVYESNEEPTSTPKCEPGLRSILTASIHYPVGKVMQEIKFGFALPQTEAPRFTEIAWLSDITRYNVGGLGMTLQAGVGVCMENHRGLQEDRNLSANYIICKATSGYAITRKLRLKASVECRVWKQLETPRVEVGFIIPTGK